MRSVNIVVFIIAAGTLLAIVAMLAWRRRQPAPVPRGRRLWHNERTLFATTYEQVGVARPDSASKADDGTACLAYDELGLDATAHVDATAIVSLETLPR